MRQQAAITVGQGHAVEGGPLAQGQHRLGVAGVLQRAAAGRRGDVQRVPRGGASAQRQAPAVEHQRLARGVVVGVGRADVVGRRVAGAQAGGGEAAVGLEGDGDRVGQVGRVLHRVQRLDAQAALVGGGGRDLHRAGRGQVRGRADGHLHVARRVGKGLDAEAVAHVGTARVELEAQTVQLHRQTGNGGARVVGQAHDAHAGRLEADFVVRGLQRGRVAHAGVQLGGAGVGAGGLAGGIGRGHEEVATRVAGQVHTQAVLRVDGGVERQRHAAQQVAHVGQVFAQVGHEAAELATDGGVVQFRGHTALHERDVDLRAVGHVARDSQAVGALPQHQGLAAGHEHAEAAVVGGDGAQLHVLTQLGDQRVALVQQVVGGAAVALAFDDALVGRGDALGQAVDGGDGAFGLLAAAVGQAVELPGGVAQAGGHLLALGQGHHAGRQVGGRGRDVGPGVEHVVERHAQAVFTGGEQGFELLQARIAFAVGRGQRTGQLRFAREVGAVRTADGADLGALAEVVAAQDLVARRGHVHRLARIALGVDVGDVVADDLQRREVGVERARADVQCSRHANLPTTRS